ncbi:MAG: hypothetical protein RML35_10335 [Chloroherpetonaceae bacterium]|nr:hypothetical protein [Chloroherpetonaceae bacterium]
MNQPATDEVTGTILTVAELEKKVTGYVEKSLVICLNSPVNLTGVRSDRLLLHLESEFAMQRLFRGQLNRGNLYLIPSGLAPTPQGIYEDSKLIFIGRVAASPLPSAVAS